MRKIKLYDSECSFLVGEAWLASSVLDTLPKYVLWRDRVYTNYFDDRYREIVIEPATDDPPFQDSNF